MRRRTGHASAGGLLIEVALLAPLFIWLLIFALEVGAQLWARLSLQHEVSEAGRFALTMRNGPQQQLRDRYLIARLQSGAVYGRLRRRCITTSVNDGATSPCLETTGIAGRFGEAGDRVRLNVSGCWPMRVPPWTGATCFTATTTYRNER